MSANVLGAAEVVQNKVPYSLKYYFPNILRYKAISKTLPIWSLSDLILETAKGADWILE